MEANLTHSDSSLPQNQERGIYNPTEIALESISRLETAKINYILSISSYSDTYLAVSDLLDITLGMSGLMSQYFTESYLQVKSNNYNILEYQYALENIISKHIAVDILWLRRIAHSIFNIWDIGFMKPMKIALPTQKPDFFRKFVNAIYSGVPHSDFNYDKHLLRYEKAIAGNRRSNGGIIHRDNFTWMCWNISERYAYDYDTNVIVVGGARRSKSTCVADMVDVILAMRGEQLKPEFAMKHIVWNAQQGFQAFRSFENSIVWNDESYFTVDRRSSLNKLQVKYLQFINATASKNNINISVIQDLTDLDNRVLRKGNVLIIVYERGSGLVFAGDNAFPIVRTPLIDTEKFDKRKHLLSSKDRAIFELSKEATYMFPINFWQRDPKRDPFWNYYLQVKERSINSEIEKASAEFERSNKDREEEEDYVMEEQV